MAFDFLQYHRIQSSALSEKSRTPNFLHKIDPFPHMWANAKGWVLLEYNHQNIRCHDEGGHPHLLDLNEKELSLLFFKPPLATCIKAQEYPLRMNL